MPKLQQIFTLDISPEKFLNSCSPTELREIDMLIQRNFYRNRMNSIVCKICDSEKIPGKNHWFSENICHDCAQTSVTIKENETGN